MSSTNFKLTTIAALVLAATNANAALYRVVEVTPAGANGVDSYGVAIKSEVIDRNGASVSDLLGCFGTSCDETNYPMAVESYKAPEGLSYREEVPFGSDNQFYYPYEFSNYEGYCINFLQYSTCNDWSSKRWTTLQKEVVDRTYSNVESFVEQQKLGGVNTVVNALDENGNVLGVTSEDPIIHKAVAPIAFVTPQNSESRAWDAININGVEFNVGSISTENSSTNEYNFNLNSKAAIWNATSISTSGWGAGVVEKRNNYYAQGSMRGVAYDGTDIYGVGYNATYDNTDIQDMDATIFLIGNPNLSQEITPNPISGVATDSNGDYRYLNSVASDINDNLIAIGHAKRRIIEGGTLSTKMFVVPDVKNPSANFLASGIFFEDSGGEAKAINNFNEIVGQVDSENIREVDGRERRHRGFIYPYQDNIGNTTVPERSEIFQDKAWWLDDLTNDGNASGANNRFRVIDASDINDAGVISATAIKCMIDTDGDGRGDVEQSYDTTSHNSYCGNASSDAVEEVVAVKLVPISGATSADIQARGTDSQNVERQGAGLGVFALTLLGFLGFRRKFK